jgi:hypothetical protein
MRIAIAVVLVALSGCGGGGDDYSADNHGFGWEFSAVSSGGLHLRRPNDPGFWPGPIETKVMQMEARFHTIEGCVGIEAPPPFVIVVPPDGVPGPPVGLYYSDPPLILIENDLAFEHEVVHYLLDYRTGDPDAAHANPAFRCAFTV